MREQHGMLHLGLVLSSFIVISSVYWDAYWHITNIRHEIFWVPPHQLATVGFALTFLLLYHIKGEIPKLTWILPPLFLLTYYLDDLWHTVIGPDFIQDPYFLWKPPHLMFLSCIIALLLIVLAEVLGTPLSLPVFAALSSAVYMFVAPLEMLGPYFIYGQVGAVFPLFAIAFLVHTYYKLGGERLLPYLFTLIVITAPLTVFKQQAQTFFPQFVHLPFIPAALIFLSLGILTDIFGSDHSLVTKTSIYTFLHAALFYGAHVIFMERYAPYGAAVLVYAVLAVPIAYLASKASDRFVDFYLHVGHHHLRSKQVKRFIAQQ